MRSLPSSRLPPLCGLCGWPWRGARVRRGEDGETRDAMGPGSLPVARVITSGIPICLVCDADFELAVDWLQAWMANDPWTRLDHQTAQHAKGRFYSAMRKMERGA